MTAAAGVGASRGLLRITNVATGQTTDYYCGGPATSCNTIQPTGFVPAGTDLLVTCAVTEDNVLVSPTVNCGGRFEPLGSF